jgi:hypothetical protein
VVWLVEVLCCKPGVMGLIPVRSLDFSIDLVLPDALWSRPLEGVSAGNLPGGGGSGFTAFCELTVWGMWQPDVSQPCGPPWPVEGLPLPFYTSYKTHTVFEIIK